MIELPMQERASNVTAQYASLAQTLIPPDSGRTLILRSTADHLALAITQHLPAGLQYTAGSERATPQGAQWTLPCHLIGNVQALPFATATFDLVVLTALLHCQAAPLPLLREAARIGKPGGNVIVFEPLSDEDLPIAVAQNAVERLAYAGHTWTFAPTELAAVIQASGLKIRRVETLTIDQSVDDWFAETPVSATNAAQIRGQLQASIPDDHTGMAPHWHDSQLYFTRKVAGIVTEIAR